MGVEEFTDRVRRLRARANLTQLELSAKSGLSYQSIQSYEDKNYTGQPRRPSVIKVARALDADPDYLLEPLGHELLDDDERAALYDADRQRLDAVWSRLSEGQRTCLVDFLETMVSPTPKGATGLGKRITPGAGEVPPQRNDNESHGDP